MNDAELAVFAEIEELGKKLDDDIAVMEQKHKQSCHELSELKLKRNALHFRRTAQLKNLFVGRAFMDTFDGSVCIVRAVDKISGNFIALRFNIKSEHISLSDVSEIKIVSKHFFVDDPVTIDSHFMEIPIEKFVALREEFLGKYIYFLKAIS